MALPPHSPLLSVRRPPASSASASPRRQMLGKLFKVKKLELVLVGIENSGKSTLLNMMVRGLWPAVVCCAAAARSLPVPMRPVAAERACNRRRWARRSKLFRPSA